MRKPDWRDRAFTAAAFLFFATLAGCDAFEPERPLAERAASAARVIGLPVPVTARIVYAEQMHGLDDAARLILILPAADWRRMEQRIERAAPGAPPASADDRVDLGSDVGDWAPSTQPGLIARQVRWRQGREALNVGTAPAAGGKTLVYLFWHEL